MARAGPYQADRGLLVAISDASTLINSCLYRCEMGCDPAGSGGARCCARFLAREGIQTASDALMHNGLKGVKGAMSRHGCHGA